MAGRGRGMTLPAWMTKDENGHAPAHTAQMPGGLNFGVPTQDPNGNGGGYNGMPSAPDQFADAQPQQQGYGAPPQQGYGAPPQATPQDHGGDRGSRRRRSPSPRGGHRDRDRDRDRYVERVK
ncbi:unnamed protein product [Discosporangium mesarthrocarpum]